MFLFCGKSRVAPLNRNDFYRASHGKSRSVQQDRKGENGNALMTLPDTVGFEQASGSGIAHHTLNKKRNEINESHDSFGKRCKKIRR